MRKKILALLVLFSLIVCALPISGGSRAAGMLCFTAVNDTLIPLKKSTLPTYFGSTLYVPYNIFTYAGVYNARSTVDNAACLYSGRKRLDFYVGTATYDQNGKLFEGVTARYSGAVLFVPLNFVCEFFELTYTVTPQEPASILRITSPDAEYSDKTFASRFRSQMLESYEEYMGASDSQTTAPEQPSPGGQISPTPPPPPTYENVTLYLSFYGIGGEHSDAILNALDAAGYKACFFVGGEDVAQHPDAVRRAVGNGHAVGIWLSDGTREEYDAVSALLFEAAKVKTVLVAADADTETALVVDSEPGPDPDPDPEAQSAAVMASENGLLSWCALDIPSGGESSAAGAAEALLATEGGVRQNVALPCAGSGADAIGSLIAYINEHKYTVGRVAETSPPPTVSITLG
ncbi:MAG: hypothetical protein LBS51_02045 [Oscillospiraceae bacterium]|jgi:hypothetical protein|nr:hypothetical protein [Oscillospiraceae bacterium]